MPGGRHGADCGAPRHRAERSGTRPLSHRGPHRLWRVRALRGMRSRRGGWRLALALVAMRSARGVPLATQTPPARAAEVPHEPVEVERVATARALRAERLARGEVAEGGAGAPDSGGPGWTSAPAAASEVRPRRQTRGRGGASGANTSAPASTARRASAGSAARQPRSAPRAGGAQTVCFLVAVQSTRRVL